MTVHKQIKLMAFFSLLCILMLPGIGSAQEDVPEEGATYRIISVETASDLGITGRFAVISPDGLKIVYADNNVLCLYTLATKESECQEYNQGAMNFVWSPDSRYVAFHQPFFPYYVESDLWLLDAESFQIYNLTDDGSTDFDSSSGHTLVDVVPFWRDDELYFFRYTEVPLIGDIGTNLYRFPVADGIPLDKEPEPVHHFFQVLDSPFSISNSPTNNMNGRVAVSPDGNTLAMVMSTYHLSDSTYGIWLLDFESNHTRQITKQESTPGLPDWINPQAVTVSSIDWRANGESLIVSSRTNFYQSIMPDLWFTVSATDGSYEHYFDLAQYSDIESLQAEIDSGNILPIPRSGIYIAEDDVFIGIHGMQGVFAIYETHLDGLAQYMLMDSDGLEADAIREMQFTSYGIDGDTVRVLIWQNLITLERNE